MSLLEKPVKFLARELELSPDQADIARYGLQTAFYTLMGLTAVSALGWLLGVLPEALSIYMAAMVLRKMSGGGHLSTPHGCILSGALVTNGLALAGRALAPHVSGTQVLLPMAAVLAAVYLYAPADVPQKPITSPVQRRTLRRLSLGFVLAWAALGVFLVTAGREGLLYYFATATLGLLWQGLLLSPMGYRLLEKLDLLFDIKKRP